MVTILKWRRTSNSDADDPDTPQSKRRHRVHEVLASRSRAWPLIAVVALANAGCGDTKQAAPTDSQPAATIPVVGSETEGTATLGTSTAAPQTMQLRDKADAGPADLDIRQLVLTLDSGTVEAQFVLRHPPTDNVIYSVFLSDSRDHSYQLAWKRAAGEVTAFLFDLGSAEQINASDTQVAGRSVALIARVPTLDDATLRFYATAETTSDRPHGIDYVPDQPDTGTAITTLRFRPR